MLHFGVIEAGESVDIFDEEFSLAEESVVAGSVDIVDVFRRAHGGRLGFGGFVVALEERS